MSQLVMTPALAAHRHLLQEWWELPQASQRRRYLEYHPGLLNPESDLLLWDTIENPETDPALKNHLYGCLAHLDEIRSLGGDLLAIRATYVNLYNGLTLDLPDWLADLVEASSDTDISDTFKAQLHMALARAKEEGLAAEIQAELFAWLSWTCYKQAQQQGIYRLLAEARDLGAQALCIYTRERYPYQFARLSDQQGDILYSMASHVQQSLAVLEEALHAYTEAASIWTRESFPAQWVTVHISSIDVMLDRFACNGHTSDLRHIEQMAYEILASGLASPAEAFSLAISLAQAAFYRWSRTHNKAIWEHGLALTTAACDFAFAPEHREAYQHQHALLLILLGDFIIAQHQQTHQLENLDAAILTRREALALTPLTHALRPYRLGLLSIALLGRYEESPQQQDLDEAMHYAQQALAMLQERYLDEPDQEEHTGQDAAFVYLALGIGLVFTFLQTWEISTVDQAISYLEKSLERTPRFDPNFSLNLTLLANALVARQGATNSDLATMDQGLARISLLLQEAQEENLPLLAQLYAVYGGYLIQRYEIAGEQDDLFLAIDAYQVALREAQDTANIALLYSASTFMGICLSKKHAINGNPQDLQEAIHYCLQAVELAPQQSPLFPMCMLNLGMALYSSYWYNRNQPALLETALEALFTAQALLPKQAVIQCAITIYLLDIMNMLYSFTGDQTYLDLIKRLAQQPPPATLDTFPQAYLYYYGINKSYSFAYLREGKQADLQAMILYAEKALQLIPEGSPYRSLIIHAFSMNLLGRYERTGSLEDLEQTITYLHGAVKRASSISQISSTLYYGLSTCYTDRSRLTNDPADLRAALHYAEMAEASAQPGSMEQSIHRINKGRVRLALSAEAGQIEQMPTIAAEMRAALDKIPRQHASANAIIIIVMEALCASYEWMEQLEDLEEAMRLGLDVLEKIGHSTAEYISLLGLLGRCLRSRFQRFQREEDRQQARAYFREASSNGAAISLEATLQAATLWGNWEVAYAAWEEAGQAYSYAMQALNLLYHEQISLSHRRQRLASANRLDTFGWDAVNIYEQAAYALACAKRTREAVTALEAGRARELGERLARDRSNLASLQRSHPQLYQHYTEQVAHLQRMEHADLVQSDYFIAQELKAGNAPLVTQIRQARESHAQTLAQIRALPGYSDFLQESTYEQIDQIASHSVPLVYLVVTPLGSLALLVPGKGREPEVIQADGIGREDLALVKQDRDGRLSGGYLPSQDVPSWMQTTLTDSLSPLGNRWMQKIAAHLHTWEAAGVVLIPAGQTGVIPWHAAPYLGAEQTVSHLIDSFAVSYAPSARVLQTARREARRRRYMRVAEPRHLLGISNPQPARSDETWVRAQLRHLAEALEKEEQELQQRALAYQDAPSGPETPARSQMPVEPAAMPTRANWAREETERVMAELRTRLVSEANIWQLEAPDFQLVQLFITSWQDARRELLRLSELPPGELLKQGQRLASLANYCALFTPVHSDIPLTMRSISQRIQPLLTYAEIEMQSIQKLFAPEHTTIFTGATATRDNVWQALPEASLLHLACHASFRPEEPLESAFVLAQNTRLTLGELLEADEQRLASVQVAVLPACQTAVIDLRELPNEVMGLFGGFLYTGVPCVIGTLWSVEEKSSALLMQRFYDLYLDGDPETHIQPQPPARALNMAQCWLRDLTYTELDAYLSTQGRQRGRYRLANALGMDALIAVSQGQGLLRPYAHPYYWAAFVCYGDALLEHTNR